MSNGFDVVVEPVYVEKHDREYSGRVEFDVISTALIGCPAAGASGCARFLVPIHIPTRIRSLGTTVGTLAHVSEGKSSYTHWLVNSGRQRVF
jgi:hypothetical protein